MSSGGMVNGFDPARTDSLPDRTRTVVERRARALGPAYRLFYSEPVQFVRGEGVYLYDHDGNAYLDAYNNVPSVGHCHPRVVAAVATQAATLNTHTRYASEPLVSYAERLLATLPDALDKVMFTCSGSEAVDLALRVAAAATGHTGIIVTANAYHGTTARSAEISPSLGPGVPLGAHVRTVAPPRSDATDPGAAFGAAVASAAADLQRHGFGVSCLIVDTILASDGVIPDPAGFLEPAAAAVRRAGGLVVADEVQPGFGRTGSTFWGFERHGLAPDLAVTGKPMGNGQPIAAMMARDEVLAPFATTARYFNTFGGNSVSIAAAAAVLDVLRDEDLPGNARDVGAHLASGLRQLGDGRIRAVRGAGLYLGVELAGADGAPGTALAQAVVDGMRQRRILISSTGSDGACLKIRPPLPFTRGHADRLVEELATVLATIPPGTA